VLSHQVQAFSYVFCVFEMLFQQVQTSNHIICAFEMLFQQVEASSCAFHALEIHVGLFYFFYRFLKCFYFGSNFDDPSSCSLLMVVLVVIICFFHIYSLEGNNLLI
jgi:hypothetical protein